MVAGVLQGDTLAPYLCITCLRTSIDKIKENGFKLAKEKSRKNPEHTITDADYADDIVLLANAPALAKILQLVNAHKMEYMCLNETGDISTLNGSSLKLVDKFTYLGNCVSSTEIDINTRLVKDSYR